jgi:phytoene desaturase
MAEAKSNYDIAIKDLVYRPGVSPLEIVTMETAMKGDNFFSKRCSQEIKTKVNPISSIVSWRKAIRYAFVL